MNRTCKGCGRESNNTYGWLAWDICSESCALSIMRKAKREYFEAARKLKS